MAVKTDKEIHANRSDITIKDKETRTCIIVDMIPSERKVSVNGIQKFSKYLEIEVTKFIIIRLHLHYFLPNNSILACRFICPIFRFLVHSFRSSPHTFLRLPLSLFPSTKPSISNCASVSPSKHGLQTLTSFLLNLRHIVCSLLQKVL